MIYYVPFACTIETLNFVTAFVDPSITYQNSLMEIVYESQSGNGNKKKNKATSCDTSLTKIQRNEKKMKL